jgi:hypothetical protein
MGYLCRAEGGDSSAGKRSRGPGTAVKRPGAFIPGLAGVTMLVGPKIEGLNDGPISGAGRDRSAGRGRRRRPATPTLVAAFRIGPHE